MAALEQAMLKKENNPIERVIFIDDWSIHFDECADEYGETKYQIFELYGELTVEITSFDDGSTAVCYWPDSNMIGKDISLQGAMIYLMAQNRKLAEWLLFNPLY